MKPPVRRFDKGKGKKVVWQKHHITYKPEKTVWIRRSEHFYITCLQRFNAFTPGAKQAIRHIMREKPDFKGKRCRKTNPKK